MIRHSSVRVADGWSDYEVIACGGGEKLERWGGLILLRPDPQAKSSAPRGVCAACDILIDAL